MVQKLKKAFAAALLVSASLVANGQATRLQFPNPNSIKEWGFSVTQYNGYSLVGSEFGNGLNVFKNNQFLFQASGPGTGLFGYAHSMNSSFIAAGAPQFGNNSQGVVFLSKHVNGNPQNNFNTAIAALTPSPNDQFGRAIDIYGDWMVIGAPNVSGWEHGGYIEIWNYTNNNWVRKTKIVNPTSNVHADYGISVAIWGNRIVVGAPGDNKLYIYGFYNNTWLPEQYYTLNTPDAGNFGYDVDVTDNHIIVGDPNGRKAYVLSYINGVLAIKSVLAPPATAGPGGDRFGHSVAIQYNRAVVGAPRPTSSGPNPNQGKVYLFTDEGGYKYKGILNVGNPSNLVVRALGYGVAIDSDIVLAGASNSDNLLTINNEGAAFTMPFYQYSQYRSGEELNVSSELAGRALIYPNPSAGDMVRLNIEAPVVSAEAVSVTGETTPLVVSDGAINVSTLKKGIYTLKLRTESETLTEKLVVE